MAKINNAADVEFIKALAALLDENGLAEIQVKREYGESDRINVRVARTQQIAHTVMANVPPVAAPAVANTAVLTEAPQSSGGQEDPAGHPGAVTSPMVGTVYLQAEPDAPTFAKVGDKVAEGDTLLIIEAMKTMNHIPAPHAGVVKRVLVSDGDPVEFGAPLMIVE